MWSTHYIHSSHHHNVYSQLQHSVVKFLNIKSYYSNSWTSRVTTQWIVIRRLNFRSHTSIFPLEDVNLTFHIISLCVALFSTKLYCCNIFRSPHIFVLSNLNLFLLLCTLIILLVYVHDWNLYHKCYCGKSCITPISLHSQNSQIIFNIALLMRRERQLL